MTMTSLLHLRNSGCHSSRSQTPDTRRWRVLANSPASTNFATLSILQRLSNTIRGWYVNDLVTCVAHPDEDINRYILMIHSTTKISHEERQLEKRSRYVVQPGSNGILIRSQPPIIERQSWAEGGSEPEVYHYIVPVGLDVIFQDEDGIEITR